MKTTFIKKLNDKFEAYLVEINEKNQSIEMLKKDISGLKNEIKKHNAMNLQLQTENKDLQDQLKKLSKDKKKLNKETSEV